MLSILLIKKIIELFIYLFIGLILVKTKILKSADSIVISKFCMYIVYPCTLICVFQQEISPTLKNDLIYASILALIINFSLIGLCELLSRLFHLSVVEKSSVIYPNSGNLIIPLISYLFGDKWLVFTAPYMAIQGVLMFTHAKGMYSKERPGLKSIFGNTSIMFTIIGLILMLANIQLPLIVGNVMTEMKNMIGPLSMLLSGMILAGKDFRSIFQNRRIWLVVALRLIVIPVILILAMSVLIPDRLAAQEFQINLILLLAAMAPAASTMVQFAQLYQSDEHYASSINILTTLFCIITMPLMVALYQKLFS